MLPYPISGLHPKLGSSLWHVFLWSVVAFLHTGPDGIVVDGHCEPGSIGGSVGFVGGVTEVGSPNVLQLSSIILIYDLSPIPILVSIISTPGLTSDISSLSYSFISIPWWALSTLAQ